MASKLAFKIIYFHPPTLPIQQTVWGKQVENNITNEFLGQNSLDFFSLKS
jgi:hypothetical protein